ncbi:PspC domain-containing protein [Patescibacteria group bacterium]|nr:PspC domain-containing protein [Patescibacteria group bacterium]MBU2159215.1 PspC domain-containing protein [Patescibacteria group bacterium]MBU2220654.1 PspC domain-containing protein [Patescibacteria group bacterium]
MKKLTRSRTDCMIAGVLGGVGEYLHVDGNIVRLIYLFALLVTGIVPGVLIYILAFFILPDAPLVPGPVHDSSEV